MAFVSGWTIAKGFHHASAQLIGKTSWSTMGDVVQIRKAVPARMTVTGVSKTTSPVTHLVASLGQTAWLLASSPLK